MWVVRRLTRMLALALLQIQLANRSPGGEGFQSDLSLDVAPLSQAVELGGDWCFQVCRDEVHKDQVPDLPYLNFIRCPSHQGSALLALYS